MNSFIDLLNSQLVGKMVTHLNGYRREVTLEVESVSFHKESTQLEPATQQNDWWPRTSDYCYFRLNFKDGSSIKVEPNEKINILGID